MSPAEILQLQNEHLIVTLYDDGSALIIDKHTDTRWRMLRVALQEEREVDEGHVWLRNERSVCEQYPARFRVRRDGKFLRYTLINREGQAVGSVLCSVTLDDEWLEFRLVNIDDSLTSLVFPPPVESEGLVFPVGVGRWVRKPQTQRSIWTLYSRLNMRWFGGLRGDCGWMAVFTDGHADAGVLTTQLCAAPIWLRSLSQWSPRTVRYRFTTGGYVGMAKAYRRWAQENGLFRSLREKMENTPALRDLIGGRIMSFMQAMPVHPSLAEERWEPLPPEGAEDRLQVNSTHEQVLSVLREIRSLGDFHGLAVVRGWIRGGYDESHPDIFPPEPALGSEEDLRQLCAGLEGITVALHDNYQDIYARCPSFPHGVNRRRDGSLMAGGFWAGGQAYILNSRYSLMYAQRNWEQIATLGPQAMFIDTTTATQLYESWEPGNMQTRLQDERYKTELLRFFYDMGLLVGSEESAEFGVPYLHWLENRHRHVPGESVPIWGLVFHDAVVCARYPYIASSSNARIPRWLPDMLWGYVLMFGLEGERWHNQREQFLNTRHVDEWHARIGMAEMTNHRYLTEDLLVEQTEFSTGEAIIANFAPEPRQVDGVTIPSGGYIIRT